MRLWARSSAFTVTFSGTAYLPGYAQAGEAKLREVITAGGFPSVRRATETPFDMILEARP
jgi:hypothetical protein